MKVLLIDPPWVVPNHGNLWKEVRSCLPSLGLAYIASFLEQHGHTVGIVDCTAERLCAEGLRARLAQYAPAPPFVGITATCATFRSALRVATAAREAFPRATIVVGGVHPTVEPGEALACPAVDIVVRGEGERTMLEIVEGRPVETIAGLAIRSGGQVRLTAARALLPDLDVLPPPAYHLLPMERYHPAVGSFRQLPAMSIFATRGCVGRCTFCHRTFGASVRKRSARSIVEEIRLLHDRYGVREIAFYDDTFTLFEEVVGELCRILVAEGPRVTWSCFTRVDRVQEDLLRLMKAAGCHLILFGVESADEGILRNIRKGISLEEVKRSVRLARRVGIQTRASFMLGNPGETEETILRTIDFAKELDPDQVQFNIATAYPGTELHAWAKERGYLVETGSATLNMSDINLNLPTISADALRRHYREAHGRFYLRPKIVLRRLRRIRSVAQMREEIRGGVAVLRLLVRRSRA